MSYVIMFKLHKPHLSGSIHSGQFMVSRLDDAEEDQNNMADDSSESERDQSNSVEIDVHNPDSVADAAVELNYRVESPALSAAKNEQLTSWNDLDRLAADQSSGKHHAHHHHHHHHHQQQHHHQYLTYYTNGYSHDEPQPAAGQQNQGPGRPASAGAVAAPPGSPVSAHSMASPGAAAGSGPASLLEAPSGSLHALDNKELLARGFNSHLTHLHQHHHLQDAAVEMQFATPSAGHHQHQYHPHAVTIDTSLTKLLECMSLYYSSKLTSPKWKSFKGLRLRLKYKIRLNNLIWRAWFLQCIRGRRPPGCQFTAPVETDVHKKDETHLLEGKYWKRREKAIVDEYKKWRTFHKQRSHQQITCFRPSSFDWDSRASNLRSYGPECHFRPDYDMNITYNLDEIPLEEIDNREFECYYQQLQPTVRMLEPAPPVLEPSQPQLHLQAEPQPTNPAPGAPPPPNTPTHQHQLEQHYLEQHQRLAAGDSSAAGSPLANQLPVTPLDIKLSLAELQASQQQNHHQQQQQQQQHHQQQQQQQQHHQQHHLHQQPQIQHHQQQQLEQHAAYQQQVADANMLNLSSASSHEMYPMSASSGTVTPTGLMECRDEQRRVCHINAEQKRRCNIKNGFDTLKSILPSISQNVNVKISKASMLQKAALYISSLSAEQKQQADEQALLRHQIDELKQTIGAYQAQLPAAGGPTGCPGSAQARELLQDYIKRRTLENWKFWLFSLLVEPLFETYYNSVSTTSLEESCKTMSGWLERNCSLMALRRDLLDSLTFLSTRTNVLNTPQTLPDEAVEAVRYQATTNSGLAAAAAAVAAAQAAGSGSVAANQAASGLGGTTCNPAAASGTANSTSNNSMNTTTTTTTTTSSSSSSNSSSGAPANQGLNLNISAAGLNAAAAAAAAATFSQLHQHPQAHPLSTHHPHHHQPHNQFQHHHPHHPHHQAANLHQRAASQHLMGAGQHPYHYY